MMSEVEKKTDPRPNFFVNFGSRIAKWFREMRSELKKVVWPTPKQVVNNTLIVIAAVLLMGVIIFCFDFLFTQLVQILINTFAKG